jgi:hypothetical protein
MKNYIGHGVAMFFLVMVFSGNCYAGPGSVQTGNIDDEAKVTTVTSIGGGEMKEGGVLGGGVKGQIGNINETVTNAGSVVIETEGDAVKTGDISDKSQVKTVTNIGSEVNAGSIVIK